MWIYFDMMFVILQLKDRLKWIVEDNEIPNMNDKKAKIGEQSSIIGNLDTVVLKPMQIRSFLIEVQS